MMNYIFVLMRVRVTLLRNDCVKTGVDSERIVPNTLCTIIVFSCHCPILSNNKLIYHSIAFSLCIKYSSLITDIVQTRKESVNICSIVDSLRF